MTRFPLLPEGEHLMLLILALAVGFAGGALIATILAERRLKRLGKGWQHIIEVNDAAYTRTVIDSMDRQRAATAQEIARRIGHIDTLDEIKGARMGLPEYNPLWDAARLIEREFVGTEV